MTGLAMALFSVQESACETPSVVANLLRTLVRARLRHAEILGVHPARLLVYFSMQEAGMASNPESFLLHAGELLMRDGDDLFLSLVDEGGHAGATNPARSKQPKQPKQAQSQLPSWPSWPSLPAVSL